MKDNLVFIVVDALRADHLECYGYDKPTSRNINNLVKNGILFEKAFSTINATDPSLTSIFSGKFPLSSGIRNHGERVTEMEKRTAENLLSFTKILHKIGYTTLGVNWLGRWHKNGYNFYGINYPWYYRSRRSSGARAKLSEIKFTTKTGINLLKKYHDRQFFLYLHYWGTHTPYSAPKAYADFFYKYHKDEEYNVTKERVFKTPFNTKWRMYLNNWIEELPNITYVFSLYDAAIAFIDTQIGIISEILNKLGIADATNLVVTADHGESLYEHGIYFDHHGLYDETIHVPLIFKGPAFPKGKKIKSLVTHVDIVPTLLDVLEIDIDEPHFDGLSLLPLLKGDVHEVRQSILSEENYTEEKMAIRTKKSKYIFSPSKEAAMCRYCNVIHGGIEELYNLESDPKELHNLVKLEPRIAKKLKTDLFNWVHKINTKKERTKIRSINGLLTPEE